MASHASRAPRNAPLSLPTPLMTRAEAQARGLKRSFTGTPCPHGYVAERFLSGHCVVGLAERSKVTYARQRAAQRSRTAG